MSLFHCPGQLSQTSSLLQPFLIPVLSRKLCLLFHTHTHTENLMYQVTSLSTAPDNCLYTLLHIRSGIYASIQILSFCLCSNKVILELEHAPEPAGGLLTPHCCRLWLHASGMKSSGFASRWCRYCPSWTILGISCSGSHHLLLPRDPCFIFNLPLLPLLLLHM